MITWLSYRNKASYTAMNYLLANIQKLGVTYSHELSLR